MVAKPQADTPDATELPKSHTVTHSLSKGTDERCQLVSDKLKN